MSVNGGAGIALTGGPVARQRCLRSWRLVAVLTIPQARQAQITGGGTRRRGHILATPEEIGFIKPMIAMRSSGTQSGATLYASSAARIKAPPARLRHKDGRFTIQ